jgi:hypothetical protein
MSPRSLAGVKVQLALVAMLAGGTLIAISGCDPRTLAYFLQPFEPTVPPPCQTSFQGKKVVILCHATSGAMEDYNSSLARDLTRELSSILQKKVKKITVVGADKVATWVEAHPQWSDPGEVGRDFEADLVIFLEVELFRLQSPGDLNMLHGESKVHVQVYEMQYPKNSKDKPIKDQPKEAVSVWNEFVESAFPNRGPIPIDTGSSRSKFRITFTKIVAKEISWQFVEHAEDDSIQDSRIER